MIEIKNLSKSFKNKIAIKNVNFNINKNEIIGFVGDNGAGKTTTIKLIFQELKKDSGEILIDSKEIDKDFELNRLSFFPDTNNFPLDCTVNEIIDYVSYLKGIDKKLLNKRKLLLIELLNLENHKNKKIKELSAGWKKRAIMASCLVAKPEYLFLDEPTANLDVKSRMEFISLLKKINNLGVTIFITTHNLEELQEFINRLIVIKDGEIVHNDSFDSNTESIAKIYKSLINNKDLKLNLVEKIFEE